MSRVMASENFAREDLTPIGEANVIGFLYSNQNLTVNEIAQIVGKKRGWVSLRVGLYEAPQDIKEMVVQKPETFSHVRVLTQITNHKDRTELIKAILEEGLTREQVQDRVSNRLSQSGNLGGHLIPPKTSKLKR